MTNRVRFTSDIDDKVSGKLDRMRDKFDSVIESKGAQGILMGVGLAAGSAAMNALGSAMSSMANYASDSIRAASDLSETVSKGRVVFGEGAAEIEKWAATASESFGQSRRQAIDAAATFATFGKGAGLAGQELVGFSTRMTELASDMASFSNTTVDESITAIGAALRGESEPIRKYGVLLDDATLRQIAFEKGLISSVKEGLTPAQKSLAAYEAILRQTGDAQGDFDRTSDGLANTQRTLAAQMEDLSADIGEQLLPVAIELAQVMRDSVVPALRDGVQLFKDMFDLVNLGDDEIKAATTSTLALAASHGNLAASAELSLRAFAATTQAAVDYGKSADGVTEATREMNRGLIGTQRETEDLAVVTTTTVTRIRRDLDGLVDYYSGLASRLQQSGEAAAAAIYDPIIARGKLAATEREIAEQREIIASKESTKAQVEDAKLRIVELTQAKVTLLAELQAHGELTKAEFLKINRDLTAKLNDATASQQAAIQALIRDLNQARLAALQAAGAMEAIGGGAGGGIGRGGGGRAHGGPVWPGVWTVGEQGPETLVVGPGMSGYVYADGGRAGGGGNTVNITLNANGVNDPVQLLRMLRRELDRTGMTLA